ncbi:MAG: nitroreductase family protein [Phycisphaerales bacterium JB063]
MQKPATTQYPVIDAVRERWSPRAFADKPVEREKLGALFEAARWAASAFNEQPWRFIVASKHDDPAEYDKALGCLVEANQTWAKAAPVLVLTACSTAFKKNGNDNRVAMHDLGQAAAHLTLQATALGLATHQMAGVDLDKVREAYNVPDGFEPQTAIAIGYPGEPDQLPEGWARDAETAPRDRMPFGEFVFSKTFGQASGLLG